MNRGKLNKGLTLKDIRRMNHAAVVAARAFYPLNSFLTLTPPRSILPCERPALWNVERGRLSQRIKRLGLPFVAQFVRELKADDSHEAGEHLHGLLYLPRDADDKVLRAFSGDIDAKLERNKGEDGILSRLAYMQKQRDGQAEGWQKMNRIRRFKWERPAPLIGPRWSMSRGLQGFVEADAARLVHVVHLPAALSAPAPAWTCTVAASAIVEPAAVVPIVPAEPVQFDLFAAAALPKVDILKHVEEKRRELGLPQKEVGQILGVKQAAYSNAFVRRHDRVGPWVMRRALEFVADRLAA